MSNTQWKPCRLSRGVRPVETVLGDRDISHNLHNPHRACTAIIVLKPQSVCVAGGGGGGCGDNVDERHLFIYLFIYSFM